MSLGPHLLGRKPPPDQNHLRSHPFVAAAPTVAIERVIKRPTLSLYDQGQTPRCVGYSTSKVMNKLNGYRFDADWLYAECKKIDGFPNEDGTNARAACDVLRRVGHWRVIRNQPVKAGPKLAHGILGNEWAQSVDAIRVVLNTGQPVLLGIDWYDAWFRPEQRGSEWWLQAIPNAGRPVGGHEIGIWAASDQRQAFGLSNTWGISWPSLVWVAYDTVAQLLAQGGDACVITDLPSR